VEEVEGVPLACRLDAADDDDDGERLLAEDVGLRGEEAGAKPGDLVVVRRGVYRVTQLRRFEYCAPG
jgi:hypothetical protein